jgi:ubiquinone biosynthesis protein UbiJ
MRDQELNKARLLGQAPAQAEDNQQKSPTPGSGFIPHALLRISVRGGGQMTAEAVRSLPLKDIAAIWKDYVNQLAMLLLEAKGNPRSSAQPQIEQLVIEGSAICVCLALGSPCVLRQLHGSRLDTMQLESEGPDKQKWHSITSSLSLSKQQKEGILQARQVYLTGLAQVLQERQALLADLEAARAVPLCQMTGLGSMYATINNCLERLQDNLKQDHDVACTFMYNAWQEIMTLFQRANVIVQAYPFFPDMLAVANAVAMLEGAPPAEHMLQQAVTSASNAAEAVPQLEMTSSLDMFTSAQLWGFMHGGSGNAPPDMSNLPIQSSVPDPFHVQDPLAMLDVHGWGSGCM